MPCKSCGSDSDLARHGESDYCGTCRELGLHAAEANALANTKNEAIPKAYTVKLTTTPTYPNLEIEEVKGVITAECVFGMNLFKDFFAGMTDFFGGRSESSQKVLRDARETCLNELKKEAYALGADGVIGIDLDYSEISGKGKGMLFLVASGTAVKFKEEAE
jgi:uncharacterized protein YbjQ (UPF0145 family)